MRRNPWHNAQKFHTHREQFIAQGIVPNVPTTRRSSRHLPAIVIKDIEYRERLRNDFLKKLFNVPFGGVLYGGN